MVCDNCGQNEAIIHLTNIEDNQAITRHLCEECAAEKGLPPGDTAANFPLTDFLAKVGKSGPESAVPGPCPFCGLRFEQFKKTGRLGCPHCYVTFEANLQGLLRRLHGGTQHLGKVYLPPDLGEGQEQERLAGLRHKLSKAVEREDFERAAELRDQIRTLEGAAND
jgi:protein arginine kinase activator